MPEEAPRVLVVLERPVQHFSDAFRRAASARRMRLSVLYWTSNRDGLYDRGFSRHVSWDVDLLSGYRWLEPRTGRRLSRSADFLRLLAKVRAEAVICFGWATWPARLAIVWCALSGTRLYLYGDSTWQHSPPRRPGWLWRLTLRLLFRVAAGALTTGTFNREFYIHHGMHPARLIDCVYPFDVEGYARARRKRVTNDRVIVVGYAGKLTARKGVDELLHALAGVSAELPWRLSLIGEGSERMALEALTTSLGLNGRVEFKGFRNASQMPAELAACDIVVLPSRLDHRGMVAAEAMAAGAAVVVSSNTGLWGRGDLVEDGVTGRVYQSGRPEQLASILQVLMRDQRKLAALQMEGAQRAEQHGPDAFVAGLERLAHVVQR